ncbi:MAG: AAA family ATPase [Mariprofundales bacterium]
MTMIDRFYIKNFRLFSDLKITNINQANLFVGKNNSCKTALLLNHKFPDIGEEGIPLGQSIDANILKSDKNSAMIFMAWLNKLFPANNNHN